MNSESLEYISHGFKLIAATGGAYIAYFSALLILSQAKSAFSRRIASRTELETIVEEESNKLSIDLPIKPFLLNETEALYRHGSDGCYHLYVGGFGANINDVKQILYKIHIREKSDDYGPVRRLFCRIIEEPRAMMYGISGIKT